MLYPIEDFYELAYIVLDDFSTVLRRKYYEFIRNERSVIQTFTNISMNKNRFWSFHCKISYYFYWHYICDLYKIVFFFKYYWEERFENTDVEYCVFISGFLVVFLWRLFCVDQERKTYKLFHILVENMFFSGKHYIVFLFRRVRLKFNIKVFPMLRFS